MSGFRRALGYLRPQRRRIAVAMACGLGVAAAYSASMGALLPVLKLLISREGPTTSTYKAAVERRVGAELRWYRPEHDRFLMGLPGSALIVRVERGGSALEAAGIGEGDALLPPAGREYSRLEFLRWLAGGEGGARRLRVVSPVERSPREAVVRLGEVSWWWSRALAVAERLPTDETPAGRLRLLVAVLGGILLINIAGNVCRFTSEYLIFIASLRAVMDIRRHMYRRAMELPLWWFGHHRSETLSRIAQDTQDIFRGYNNFFSKVLREPLKAVGVLGVALWVDWRLTLALCVGAPISAMILARLGKRVRKATRKLLAGYARMVAAIAATLDGMRIVRAYSAQGYERRRMWRVEARMMRQHLRIGRIEALTSPLMEVLGLVIAMGGTVWLAANTFTGRLSPEGFLLMVTLLAAVFDPIRRVASAVPKIHRADGAAQRVFELIDMPVEREAAGRRELGPLRERIEFRGVSYQYPEASRPSLVDIDLTLPAGQTIAIVGPNGSGKTTLVSLLLRFFDPTEGAILFDGVDIREVTLRSLRRQFSLVTQEPVVFAATVRENIAYGCPNAPEEAVRDAARRAFADEFIERLPAGYDTVVGEFGATLSGGERQRLALARAIFRDAPIFIFDEATSQVDAESEVKIRRAMKEFMRGRTSIVIAHRIATVQEADLIVVLEGGRVVDTGDHASLVARCELYQSLYYSHARGLVEDAASR